MDFADIGLRAVGAFYVFAGVVATRAAITSRFLDVALAQISLQKPSRGETAQTVWLIVASLIILAGGAALVLKWEIAVWLFLVSAAMQALYLYVIAPRWFDLEDPPDAAGRRQTTNAFVIYLAATAFVVWAFAVGKLLTTDKVPSPALLGIGAAVIAYVGYTAWMLRTAQGS